MPKPNIPFNSIKMFKRIGTCSLVINKLECIFSGYLLLSGIYSTIYSHCVENMRALFPSFVWSVQCTISATTIFFNSSMNDINICFDILAFFETMFNILHFYSTYLLCLCANFHYDSSAHTFL